jgi:hypothetical protein
MVRCFIKRDRHAWRSCSLEGHIRGKLITKFMALTLCYTILLEHQIAQCCIICVLGNSKFMTNLKIKSSEALFIFLSQLNPYEQLYGAY